MSRSKKNTNINTLDYYNACAESYCENTLSIDMSDLLDKFLGLASYKGEILDWGCGSGRDSLYMMNKGFEVTSIDGSPEMCKIAEKHIGKPVICQTFEELNYKNRFGGIWANASLLHCRYKQLPFLFNKALAALKDDGVFFASFKYGNFSGEMEVENSNYKRYFTNLTEDSAAKLLKKLKYHACCVFHITKSRLPNGKNQSWLNIFMLK